MAVRNHPRNETVSVDEIVSAIVYPIHSSGRPPEDMLKFTESVVFGVLCAVETLGGDEDGTAADRMHCGVKQQITERRKILQAEKDAEIWEDRLHRVKHANKVLRDIGSFGRRFFYSTQKSRFAGFGLKDRVLWFTDAQIGDPFVPRVGQEWKSFSLNPECREIVVRLYAYIWDGTPMDREIFLRTSLRNDGADGYRRGDSWGYGKEEMAKVRALVFVSPAVAEEQVAEEVA